MSADFDKAIDRAVREMLDLEPSAELRQRVLERLPASGSRLPAFGWAAAVAAAAIVILAVLLTRGTPPQRETTTVELPQSAAPVTGAPAALEPRAVQTTPETSAPGRRAVVGVRRAEQAITGATYADAAAPADDIEPLQSLPQIQVAPVAPRAITQTVIAIPALSPIADLEIAPLNPPERRN